MKNMKLKQANLYPDIMNENNFKNLNLSNNQQYVDYRSGQIDMKNDLKINLGDSTE